MRKNMKKFLFVVMAMLALAITGCTSTTTAPTASKAQTNVIHKMGDTFQVADFQYTVNSVKAISRAGVDTEEKGNMVRGYYDVNLTVKNIGNTGSKLDWKWFFILQGEKKYVVNDAAYLVKDVNSYLFDKTLNPQSSMTGDLLFEDQVSVTTGGATELTPGMQMKVKDGKTNGESETVQLN